MLRPKAPGPKFPTESHPRGNAHHSTAARPPTIDHRPPATDGLRPVVLQPGQVRRAA
eukprot:SAG22_NODE_13639_length_399_cov_1.723333_1_plen_56_part_10